MKRITALLASLLLVLSIGSTAVAAPTTTLTLNPSAPTHGDAVTYTVTTTAEVSNIWINCYQNGNLVYWAGGLIHRTSTWSETHILSSAAYSGGVAQCTAQVNAYHNNKRVPKPLLVYNFTTN